jgi:hypothetical protein
VLLPPPPPVVPEAGIFLPGASGVVVGAVNAFLVLAADIFLASGVNGSSRAMIIAIGTSI